jgi:uncharacterized protein YjbI with pentapeptide repeats
MESTRRCTLKAFVSLLDYGGNDSPLIVEEEGEISNNKSFQSIRLTNVTFEQKINFKDIQFNEHLHFTNCIFDELEFVDVVFLKSVTFESCICKKTINFTNCSHDTFKIINGEYEKLIFRGAIKESRVGQNIILFEKGTFNKVEFKTREVASSINFIGANVQDLDIIKTRFLGSLNFDDDSTVKRFIIESCDFLQRADFAKSTFEWIYIRKVNFNEQVVFHKEFRCGMLDLSNTFSVRSISVTCENENIGSLHIGDCKFDGTLSLDGNLDKNANDNSKVSLNLSGTFHGIVYVKNISIGLHLSLINFGTLHFDNIKTKIITFQDFHNYGKLTVSNIIKDEYYNCLIIYDSNIHLTEFINVNFREFNEVVIAKSNVSSIILSNSFLPRNIQTETKMPVLGYKIKSINTITDNSYKRENYRQLKIAMESQSNRSESLQYKAQEMHYLRKDLRFGWEKILLYLNFISNNHGLSWIRGIFFTFTCALFFFFMYEYSIGSPHFYWTYETTKAEIKNGFNSGTRDFLRYLATFPSLRFENDGSTSSTSFIILLSRIFIGYGIYQTITAFRKFGGK